MIPSPSIRTFTRFANIPSNTFTDDGNRNLQPLNSLSLAESSLSSIDRTFPWQNFIPAQLSHEGKFETSIERKFACESFAPQFITCWRVRFTAEPRWQCCWGSFMLRVIPMTGESIAYARNIRKASADNESIGLVSRITWGSSRFLCFVLARSVQSSECQSMDYIFDCFFEEILATIERSGLKTRQNRQNVIDQLDAIITGCSAGSVAQR